MKPLVLQSLSDEIQDDQQADEQFFSPFNVQINKLKPKEVDRIQSKTVFCKLLTFSDEQNHNMAQNVQNSQKFQRQACTNRDENLMKIIGNGKQIKSLQNCEQNIICEPPYSFNFDINLSYVQTPGFKYLLQSPLRLFSKNYNSKIQQLQTCNLSIQKFNEVKKEQNPLLYFSKPATYFIGISIYFQNKNMVNQSLFFLNLACYIQPYNSKVWQEIISYSKKNGLWKKACLLSKTAFLFIPCNSFAQQYLLCADKAQIPAYQVRNLLTCLKHPEKYEKSLIESAKYQIKNRKLWRGLHLLNKFCSLSNYRLNSSSAFTTLAKCLQNIGFQSLALKILQKAIQKGAPRLEVFYSYIQINLRINKGYLDEKNLAFLKSHAENITVQTRYRLWLCLAQILIKLKNKKYEQYLHYSYKLATKYCKGLGKQRAYRQIYFSLITNLNISPQIILNQNFQNDDYLKFLYNRQKFIKGQSLYFRQFKNWKFYLHLALLKNPIFLIKIFEDNNQGRIVAEAIHVLRLSKDPVFVLKFWREKIEQIPKSGELWCEGGRIYVNLSQFENARKCFQSAIHFTPQFGDSFIQLLRINLKQSKFYEANQLRKRFQMSQPYYGNVLSFLQQISRLRPSYRHSLRDVWERAFKQINIDLYSKNYSIEKQLTSSLSYNEAFQYPSSPQIRQILFSSYEQMENKNPKS